MEINWTEAYKLWREFEGLRLNAYPDPASGNEPWTIGYGHTGLLSGTKVKRGDKITKKQAEQFMRNDLNAIVKKLTPLIKTPLNPNQWAALVSFAANLKWNTFIKSSVLTYINQGKLNEVPGRMALYRLGDGKVMPGLVRRRTAEGALWMTPLGGQLTNQTPDVEESSAKAEPAQTKKPWDWGVVGGFITLMASISNDVKTTVGNFTSAFGIDPVWILVAAGIGFAGWTIWNKWKDK